MVRTIHKRKYKQTWIYPDGINAWIEERIPQDVRDLISTKGWNVLGFHQAVQEILDERYTPKKKKLNGK